MIKNNNYKKRQINVCKTNKKSFIKNEGNPTIFIKLKCVLNK